MFEPVSLTQIGLFGFAVDVVYSSLLGVSVEAGGWMPLFCLHTVKRKKGLKGRLLMCSTGNQKNGPTLLACFVD